MSVSLAALFPTPQATPERQRETHARRMGLLIPGATRVSEIGAAEYVGISAPAMAFRRRRGTGPTFYIHQGRVAYDVAVLKEWAVEKGLVSA